MISEFRIKSFPIHKFMYVSTLGQQERHWFRHSQKVWTYDEALAKKSHKLPQTAGSSSLPLSSFSPNLATGKGVENAPDGNMPGGSIASSSLKARFFVGAALRNTGVVEMLMLYFVILSWYMSASPKNLSACWRVITLRLLGIYFFQCVVYW